VNRTYHVKSCLGRSGEGEVMSDQSQVKVRSGQVKIRSG